MSKAENIFVNVNDLMKMEGHANSFHNFCQPRKVKQILGGSYFSTMRGRGLEFEEVRNYIAGDDIRNIDWKVTARTHKIHSKVFSEEKEKPTMIILDQQASMFFGTEKHMKSKIGSELAAIISFWTLKEGDRVGGIVISNDHFPATPAKRDRKNILQFFNQIQNCNKAVQSGNITENPMDLKLIFDQVNQVITHDFLVVIISDFHRYDPNVVHRIGELKQHNDVVLAKVNDPLEREIPKSKFILGSKGKQLIYDGRKSSLRKSHQETSNKNSNDFIQRMNSLNIPVLEMNTVEDTNDQLKKLIL